MITDTQRMAFCILYFCMDKPTKMVAQIVVHKKQGRNFEIPALSSAFHTQPTRSKAV